MANMMLSYRNLTSSGDAVVSGDRVVVRAAPIQFSTSDTTEFVVDVSTNTDPDFAVRFTHIAIVSTGDASSQTVVPATPVTATTFTATLPDSQVATFPSLTFSFVMPSLECDDSGCLRIKITGTYEPADPGDPPLRS